jgi:hypothetical protein
MRRRCACAFRPTGRTGPAPETNSTYRVRVLQRAQDPRYSSRTDFTPSAPHRSLLALSPLVTYVRFAKLKPLNKFLEINAE